MRFVRVILLLMFLSLTSSVFGNETLDSLLLSKKYNEAIDYFKNNVKKTEYSADILSKIGLAYEKIGKNDSAVTKYNESLNLDNKYYASYAGLARYNYKIGQYSKSLEYFKKSYILKRNAKTAEGIALSASKLKQWDKARDAAESAILLDSVSTIESRKIISKILLKNKQYKSAIIQLIKIIEQEPTSLTYYEQLALCYEKTNSYEQLISVDKKIVNMDKKNIKSRQRLASYYKKQKDYVNSQKLYKELSALTPRSKGVFKNLYELSVLQSNDSNTLIYLKKYLALNPSDAELQKVLGNILYKNKDFVGALRAYRIVFKLNPQIKGYYNNYAKILVDNKLESEAVKVINRAISAGDADKFCYVSLGDIYKKTGKYLLAVKMYTEALKKDPKDIKILISLGESQLKSNDLKNAVITYEQVVIMNPNVVREFLILGNIHLKLNRKKDAVDAYKKYLQKTTDNNDAPAKIVGIFEFKNKNYKEALKYLKMVKDTKLFDSEFLKDLGLSYYYTNDFKNAKTMLLTLYKSNPPISIIKKILKPLAVSCEKTNENLKAAYYYKSYTMLSGVKDADASFKSAFLKEQKYPQKAMEIYLLNIKKFPKDYRNFKQLGLLYSLRAESRSKAISVLTKSTMLNDTVAIVWETLSDLYKKSKNLNKELLACKKLQSLKPKDFTVNKRLAMLLVKKKLYKEAIKPLQSALSEGKGNLKDIKLLLAKSYSEIKDYQNAVSVLEDIIKDDPSDRDVRITLIKNLKILGLTSRINEEKLALSKLDIKALVKTPNDLAALLRLAEYYFDLKNYKDAYYYYQKASRLSPKNKNIAKKLYLASSQLSNSDNTIKNLQNYLKLDSKNDSLYVVLGNLMYDKKDFSNALEAFRNANRLNPKLSGYLKKYETILLKKKLYNEALKIIKLEILSKEADTTSYFALGNIYKSKHNCPLAIKYYKEAVNRGIKDLSAMFNLGICQKNIGDIQNAIITFEQLVLLAPNDAKSYKVLGDLLLKKKNKSEAVKTYKKYLEKQKNDDNIAKLVGYYEFDKKEYGFAIKYLQMVSDSTSFNSKYYLTLGESYYNLQDYKNASKYFEIVKKRKISTTYLKRTMLPLANSYENLNNKYLAGQAYASYVSIPGVIDADASFKSAFYVQKKNPNIAIKRYEKNIIKYPSDYRNFYELGVLYLTYKKDYLKASIKLKKASVLNTQKPDIWNSLAKAYGLLNKRNSELSAYQKYLALMPNDFNANKRVGEILVTKKQYEKALPYLEKSLKLSSEDFDVIMLLVKSYSNLNDKHKTIKMLTLAKQQNKDDINIRERLYNLYKDTKAINLAEYEIKELISLKKSNKYRILYSNDLINQGRYDDALTMSSEILKIDPMSVDGYMVKGIALRHKGMLNDAMETFKMVLFMKDNYAPALYERGVIYFKQGNIERAENYFKKAIKANPKDALAELRLAQVFKNKNDLTNYKLHLQKAIKLDPNNAEIITERNAK